jgi:hypothetical protein
MSDDPHFDQNHGDTCPDCSHCFDCEAMEVRSLMDAIASRDATIARLEAILDAVNDDIGSDYLDLIAEELES